MRVEITFDHREWDALMRAWEEPAVHRTLDAAASAFGRAAKPIIRDEIPVARPGNDYAKGPGNLRDSTRYRRIRHGNVGVVIGPMGRTAFYRGWVAGGTRAHVIPGAFGRVEIRHPGARPNDFIGRAAGRAESAGFDKAEAVIFDGLDGKRVAETFDI